VEEQEEERKEKQESRSKASQVDKSVSEHEEKYILQREEYLFYLATIYCYRFYAKLVEFFVFYRESRMTSLIYLNSVSSCLCR
jgi:hypothetical protein